MKRMKRAGCFFLVLMLVLSIAGCSKTDKSNCGKETVLTSQQFIEQLNDISKNEWDYEQDFSDLAKVNQDFSAFYLTQFMGEWFKEEVAATPSGTAHWAQSAEAGLVRAGDISSADGMANYAMLAYTAKRYANYRMQVEIKQGTATNYWAMLGIRLEEAGKHVFADGLGYYCETDGSVKAWGHGLHGGPYDMGKIAEYSQSAYQTYTVTVSGNYCIIESGGSTILSLMPTRFYRQGFITFYSINNDTAIRNFKVKELPRSETALSDFPPEQALPSADSDDSLDNMAGNK